MKKRRSVLAFGPGAPSLILIFVVLSMTALGMLSLLSARNDYNLSKRSVQVVEAQYALNQQAEEYRAAIDAVLMECRASADTQEAYLDAIAENLPEGAELEEDILRFSVTDGSRTMRCSLLIHDLSNPVRSSWQLHSLTAETGEEIWN